MPKGDGRRLRRSTGGLVVLVLVAALASYQFDLGEPLVRARHAVPDHRAGQGAAACGPEAPGCAPGSPGGAADARSARRRSGGATRARSPGGSQEARTARGRRGRPAVRRQGRLPPRRRAGHAGVDDEDADDGRGASRGRPAAPVHHEGGGHPAVQADRARRGRRPVARQETERRLPRGRGHRHPRQVHGEGPQEARAEPGDPRLRRLAVLRSVCEPEVGADLHPRGRGQPDLGALGRRGARAAGPRLPQPHTGQAGRPGVRRRAGATPHQGAGEPGLGARAEWWSVHRQGSQRPAGGDRAAHPRAQ